MPGRRHPRRSQDETQSSHVRSVFRGGMDGATSIPYPVGWRKDQNDSKNTCLQTSFFDESFAASGGVQTITLNWLPIPYSEHVYLWRSGQGIYQSEGIAWARDAGSRTIRTLPGMNSQLGDTIVVEYAYYEQTSEPCGPQSGFPDTIFRGAPSYIPVNPESTQGYWLPRADNFPYTPPAPGKSYAREEATVYVSPHFNYITMTSVPGIAPGSTYARKISSKDGEQIPRIWFDPERYLGTPRQPMYQKATVLGASVWYEVINPKTPPAGDGYDYSFWLSSDHEWTSRGSNRPDWYFEPALYWMKDGSGWRLNPNAYYPNVGQGPDEWRPPFPDPRTPGPHFVSVQVNCREQTLTAKFDDYVFTTERSAYIYPSISLLEEVEQSNWFPPSPWEEGDPYYDGGGSYLISYFIVDTVDALIVDEFRIFDDFPVCVWDDYTLNKMNPNASI